MPGAKSLKQCACKCGEMTKAGDFRPGDDAKLQSAAVEAAGVIIGLRRIVGIALETGMMPRWDR